MPRVSIQRRNALAPTVGRELELTMRLRNNCLRSRRTELGLTVDQFCRQARVSKGEYSALETLRKSPLRSPRNPEFMRDPWRPIARRLAKFFRCPPDDLWPDAVIAVKNPMLTTELAGEKAIALARYARTIDLPLGPEARLIAAETKSQLDVLMRECLSDVEREAIRAKFGFDAVGEQTCRAITKEAPRVTGGIGVSGAEVQRRVTKALWKLRYRIGDKVGRAGPVPWADLTIDRRFVEVEKRSPDRRIKHPYEPEPARPTLRVVPKPIPEPVPDLGADFGEDEGVTWKCSACAGSAGGVLTELEAVVVFGAGIASLVHAGRPTVPVQVLGSTFWGPLGPMFRPSRVCIRAEQVRELYRIANERNLEQWDVHVQITGEAGRAGVILRLVAK